MHTRNIIVIGSSAGGVIALQELVALLPANFQASIFVVQHISAHSPSMLAKILTSKGNLPAEHPEDGEVFETGRIYIAPPNRHMLIEGDHILVKKGPKENRFRPSIDALFRSAAYSHGSRVIGVILTGMLDDGTSGLWSVKRLGGISIIQKPDEAKYPTMPLSALEYVDIDHIESITGIANLLVDLVHKHAPTPEPLTDEELDQMKIEIETAAQKNAFEKGILTLGPLSPLTCPECKGVLIELKEGDRKRYRCHTGHSFQIPSLLAAMHESIESRLWEALQNLEEIILILEETADAFEEKGEEMVVGQYRQQAELARKKAFRLRKLIFE